MMKTLSLCSALLCLAGSALAADAGNEWQLRIKNHGNSWTASFSGPVEYGAPGKRVRGSGLIVEKARALAAFSKIRLDGPMNLRLSQAGADTVRVSADDNIEPLIETVVEGDTLVLRLQKGAGLTSRHAPTVLVESKSLQALSIHGSGDVSLDRFKGDKLSLALAGSGDLRIGLLEVKELIASVSGSGDVEVAGQADSQQWQLQGSGDVNARSLSGRSVQAQLTGSGDMSIGVTQNLDVTLRGSGDLRYAGRPQLRQTVTGSGEISGR
ncbi:hypothetical protein HNP55_001765 [Paucibacter oligotrophus]|uniref:Putative auto-transporter adhesin head GIN domain-containing protein n=1 Tax=Roseateles oligotrophus TaxID=1769250 RepID=A0A840L5F1_9BURK|nr:head GIN domain-containing protein [Roseateles oligotrophus]MBB4843246.1 hypothetical protein [Roseateles oligotrophus]